MSDAGTLGVFDRVIASTRLPLGAPGLYLLNEKPATRLGSQRMDVAAFVGVALRGPAYVPITDAGDPAGWQLADPAWPRARSVAVPVASFDEYVRRFGGFEGPGLLPRAVAAFFGQGGRRAYVVRIVAPQHDPLAGCARGRVTGVFTTEVEFLARDQGTWGDALRITAALRRAPLKATGAAAGTLIFDQPGDAPAGTLLALGFADGARTFAFVERLSAAPDVDAPTVRWEAELAPAHAAPPASVDAVGLRLVVRDGAGVEERFDDLGLDPVHPRFFASVLCAQSTLVWPAWASAQDRLLPAGPDIELLRSDEVRFADGADFWGAITPDHFFDPFWSPAEDAPGEGIAAVAGVPDATHLVVPDLYVPAATPDVPAPPAGAASDAGAEFADCISTAPTAPEPAAVSPSALVGLLLNPRRAGDRAEIARRQAQIVAFCEQGAALIALVDVPPGLTRSQIERWRADFDTSWCAAYHPWLRTSQAVAGERTALRPMPPSAVAAGIIARREIVWGVQTGPANEIGAGIVDVAEPVPDALLDALHPQGVNCFRRDPDGIRLVGARTLSHDPQWRQLSVRRLVLMLRRTLLREMQWVVFEPNTARLAADLRHSIEALLRRLFRAGAFAGRSEQEAFFVRVLQAGPHADRGEIVVEIGVAPAEPLEFLVLRLRRDRDGDLTVEG
jgi:hypothetical protein